MSMNEKLPKDAVVWAEIPVSDMDKGKAFYSEILQVNLVDENLGPNPMAMFNCEDPSTGTAGHIYPGKPAGDGTGPTVSLAVSEDLGKAMSRVEPAGGKVLSPIIEIPAGRFFYCTDPDGNSLSLFAR